MKKIFRKLHLWLSIPFGIVITLICFSGASLVFEQEITRCLHHDLYYVENQSGQPMALDALMQKVATTLPDSVEITGVTIFPDASRAYQVSLSKPRRASMMVDQYTGEVKGRVKRDAFFSVMFRMHRWLLGSSSAPGGGMSAGKLIVGISTLVFVITLITGVVIWFPTRRKSIKSRFEISVKHGWFRFWHGLHNAGGIYALILLLAMSLTGLTWSFPWYRAGFYGMFGVESQRQQPGGKGKGDANRGDKGKPAKEKGKPGRDGKLHGEKHGGKEANPFAQWQAAYDAVVAKSGNCDEIRVGDGKVSVSSFHFGNGRAADTYEFDSVTGKLTKFVPYEESAKQGKAFGTVYSVHTGSWGGLITRILTCVSALIGASLPITGYYLWIRRLRKKH